VIIADCYGYKEEFTFIHKEKFEFIETFQFGFL
jgi:hypothetical protein